MSLGWCGKQGAALRGRAGRLPSARPQQPVGRATQSLPGRGKITIDNMVPTAQGKQGKWSNHKFCSSCKFLDSKGLVTNYREGGGGFKTGWGACEVLPLWLKGGAEGFKPY